MSDRIFADTAPAYWAKGLPVIPLAQRDKRPVVNTWQFFADRMPTLAEQNHWLNAYAAGNIGLVLGQQSGMIMLDVDTEEQRLQQVINECLQCFPSPWVRVGSKGMVLAYKQPIGQTLKTFRIRRTDAPKDSASVIEGLSSRTQVVLPPSIHPKGMIYGENCSLLDCMDELPHLPYEIEKVLRAALIEEGVSLSQSGYTKLVEFVSSGARDNQMVKVAGLQAQGVTRGDHTLLQGIERLEGWALSCVERIAGDDIDINKGISQYIHYITKDVLEAKKTLPAGWDLGLTDERKEQLGLVFNETHEEWSYDQIMTYLQNELEKHGSQSSTWLTTIEYILDRLSRSRAITGLYEESILRYIADCSGKKFTIATLRKRMREMRTGDVRGDDHTEIARAVVADRSRFGELRYENGKFWQWGGSYWEEQDENDMLFAVAENFGHLPAAKRRGDHIGIVKIMATICTKELVQQTIRGVNFANGFVTSEMKIVPHNPDYGCTYSLPFRYLPDEAHKAMGFMRFLDRAFSDPVEGPDEDRDEKIMAIQEAMCATLFGMGPALSRAILLYGLSNTGKSELLKIVHELVPEGARSAVPPNDWGDKFLPAQMAGKLLNVAGELSADKKIDGQKFKSIITGDMMTAQFKNGQPFDYKPVATHWFASNDKPASGDQTDGFNRRWLIIGFRSRITKQERVVDIGTKLVAEEREQIVAWVMQAMSRLIEQQDYTLPASHVKLINDVAYKNNSVLHFLKEGGVVKTVPPAPEGGSKTSHHTSEAKLYVEYSNFCFGKEGVKRAGLLRFRERMEEFEREMGFKKVTTIGAGGAELVDYHNLILVGSKGL